MIISGLVIWATLLVLGWYLLKELGGIATTLERIEERLAERERMPD